MKQLYIDCGMGAAGDMLTAALLQLLPDPERAEALADLNGAGIPGVTFEAVPGRTCGIAGLSMRVRVNGAEEGAPVSDDGHAGGAEEGVHAAYGGQAGSAAEPHGGHTHGHAHRSMESIRAMIAALAAAAAGADGETVIRGLHHIDRGYEDFAAVFNSLGADAERGSFSA